MIYTVCKVCLVLQLVPLQRGSTRDTFVPPPGLPSGNPGNCIGALWCGWLRKIERYASIPAELNALDQVGWCTLMVSGPLYELGVGGTGPSKHLEIEGLLKSRIVTWSNLR